MSATTATYGESRRRLIVFYRFCLSLLASSCSVLDGRRHARRSFGKQNVIFTELSATPKRSSVSREYRKRFFHYHHHHRLGRHYFLHAVSICSNSNIHVWHAVAPKNTLFKLKFEFSNFHPKTRECGTLLHVAVVFLDWGGRFDGKTYMKLMSQWHEAIVWPSAMFLQAVPFVRFLFLYIFLCVLLV